MSSEYYCFRLGERNRGKIVKITQKGGKKEELKEKMDLKKGEEEREK